jgi:ribosomal protein S18 acetylase RimI-like enzyme
MPQKWRNMELVQIDIADAEKIASMAADFRVQLNSFKGIRSTPDEEAAKEEIMEFLEAGFPVYAVRDGGVFAGYLVCRIDHPCLWVEHIFVSQEYRRKGVGTMLFNKAEEIAAAMGEETVFNFVHPNNAKMIAFLRSKGYTVLNMIEIRKPYKWEKLTGTIDVGNESFDY